MTAYEMRICDWSSDVCSSDLVLRLIDEARCLVLEHPGLIVDLLQRPRGGKDVLAVVGRIEHDDRLCWRRRHDQGHRQRAGGTKAQRTGDQVFLERKSLGHGHSPRGWRLGIRRWARENWRAGR